MSFGYRHYGQGSVRPSAIDTKRFNKFVRENFGVQPFGIKNDGTSAASGVTGTTNLLFSPRSVLEHFILGTQTIVLPVWDAANGLNIAQDQTAGDGVEITAGIGALSLGTFVVGTDRSFYVKATFKNTDASGSDGFLVGFRKNQAYQATFTSYTDYAAIGFVTSANPAAIKIQTNLASAGAVITDTTQTWADNEVKTLKVIVRDDGSVRFYINEADPIVTQNYTFSAGAVNWFIRHIQAADLTDQLYLRPQTLTIGGQVYDQPALEFGYTRRNAE